jgi:hypothetical protein
LAAYVETIVLPFGLCPWALAAWRDGRTRTHVSLAGIPDVAEVLSFVVSLEATAAAESDSSPAVGFFLAPRYVGRPSAWEKVAEAVRQGLRATASGWYVAAFHPGFPDRAGTPGELVSSLRRTPDPMLQLLSARALSSGGAAGASDDVAQRNFALARSAQGPALAAAFDALLADRAKRPG